jgi:hypothetical protein
MPVALFFKLKKMTVNIIQEVNNCIVDVGCIIACIQLHLFSVS